MNSFVPRPAALELPWRKSSYSGANGDCVELAEAGTVSYVRDSKDPEGPALVFAAEAWGAFVAGVKADEFQDA
ncbi:DUF397 domain-containing protein [Kitasatospora indigofera]|uniref:DUF397 domain-containing protein n=1 Tax=Kitasatospora indigofera TaxID=67307 RepID=UPI0036776EB4